MFEHTMTVGGAIPAVLVPASAFHSKRAAVSAMADTTTVVSTALSTDTEVVTPTEVSETTLTFVPSVVTGSATTSAAVVQSGASTSTVKVTKTVASTVTVKTVVQWASTRRATSGDVFDHHVDHHGRDCIHHKRRQDNGRSGHG